MTSAISSAGTARTPPPGILAGRQLLAAGPQGASSPPKPKGWQEKTKAERALDEYEMSLFGEHRTTGNPVHGLGGYRTAHSVGVLGWGTGAAALGGIDWSISHNLMTRLLSNEFGEVPPAMQMEVNLAAFIPAASMLAMAFFFERKNFSRFGIMGTFAQLAAIVAGIGVVALVGAYAGSFFDHAQAVTAASAAQNQGVAQQFAEGLDVKIPKAQALESVAKAASGIFQAVGYETTHPARDMFAGGMIVSSLIGAKLINSATNHWDKLNGTYEPSWWQERKLNGLRDAYSRSLEAKQG